MKASLRHGALISAAALSVAWSLLFAGDGAAFEGKPDKPDEHPRVAVDIHAPPWNAVVRVQTNLATRCSGTLVAPDKVLTAAHCLINKRTAALLPAGLLHVLVGYDRGGYTGHYFVNGYTVDPTYDSAKPLETLGKDWAVLTLGKPVSGIAPLPVWDKVPTKGTSAAATGYYQDRAQILMADMACAVGIVVQMRGGRLMRHDCAASHGTSGGPLLVEHNGQWGVVGVTVATANAANLAVPTDALDHRQFAGR